MGLLVVFQSIKKKITTKFSELLLYAMAIGNKKIIAPTLNIDR